MSTEETLRLQIEDLERRIAELADRLNAVTEERDTARAELAHWRLASGARFEERPAPDGESYSDTELCTFCDGEGNYWVHDFEMKCTRCAGTGLAQRPSHPTVPES